MTKKKILVIDDEPSIRFLLNEFLTDIGYECIEAERAIKGIEILRITSYNVCYTKLLRLVL